MTQGQELPQSELTEYQEGLKKRYQAGEELTFAEKMELIGDPKELVLKTEKRQKESEIVYNIGEERAKALRGDYPNLSLDQLVSISRKQISEIGITLDKGFYKYSEDNNMGAAEYYRDFSDTPRNKTEWNRFKTNFVSLKNADIKKQGLFVRKMEGLTKEQKLLKKEQIESAMHYANAADVSYSISGGMLNSIQDLDPDKKAKAETLITEIEAELLKDIGSPGDNGEPTQSLLQGDMRKIRNNLRELYSLVQYDVKNTQWYNSLMTKINNNRKLLRKVTLPDGDQSTHKVEGFTVEEID
jgi:hypothetical protein